MKTIKVVAAVIKNEDKIFATQRGYGEFKDGWEFPGGKIEAGEIEYDYPTFHLSMQCFWCTIVEGNLVLKEHEAAKWLDKEHLYSVDWLPADIGLIGKIEKDM